MEKTESGTVKVNPESRRAIKYIFARTIAGGRRKKIIAMLNEKFAPMSNLKNSNGWNEPMVASIVKSRRVLGELKTSVTGEAFPNQYPQVLDEATWIKANAEVAKRSSERGSPTVKVNPFNGILFHALDDCKMGFQSYSRTHKDGTIKRFKRYKSYNKSNGIPGASSATIDVEGFENLVFQFFPTLNLKTKTS